MLFKITAIWGLIVDDRTPTFHQSSCWILHYIHGDYDVDKRLFLQQMNWLNKWRCLWFFFFWIMDSSASCIISTTACIVNSLFSEDHFVVKNNTIGRGPRLLLGSWLCIPPDWLTFNARGLDVTLALGNICSDNKRFKKIKKSTEGKNKAPRGLASLEASI